MEGPQDFLITIALLFKTADGGAPQFASELDLVFGEKERIITQVMQVAVRID